MRINSHLNQKSLIILILLNILISRNSVAQITGSLFMLPDNFYAQMYNPSYMRTDDAVAFSVAGVGGFSFINQGNFKISDLITTTSSGNPVIDFENFYNNIKTDNFFRQDFSLPMAFFSIPVKEGIFSFYYKENFSSVLKFKKDIFEFLIIGNYAPDYRYFNSDNIELLTIGYREFAFGYSKNLNKKIDVGARAKLLFGAALVDANNWNYGIGTTGNGDIVSLNSRGSGQLMLPVPVIVRSDSTLYSVEKEKAATRYLTAYQNPGIAIDLGVTFYINESSTFSAAIRDLGGIWYRHNTNNMYQDVNDNFEGFDLISAVRYPEEQGYTDPAELVALAKDNIRLVYHPVLVETGFIFKLPLKTVFHYQYLYSNKHSFGITNQSAFQRNNFQNILTLSAMQSRANLSVFENLNLHGASDISLGGGIQYEGNFIHAFLATDNVIAFYHPAANKTFSITAGICLLLNHKKDAKSSSMKERKGKTLPELPFYKRYGKIPNH